jgi:hypothetical protein
MKDCLGGTNHVHVRSIKEKELKKRKTNPKAKEKTF